MTTQQISGGEWGVSQAHCSPPAAGETVRAKRKRASLAAAPTAGPVPNANGHKFVELQRVVAEMRLSVLQSLKNPNFQHGKAAQNIRRALREIRALCKHIRSETVLIAKHTPKRAYDGEMGVGLARYRQKMAAGDFKTSATKPTLDSGPAQETRRARASAPSNDGDLRQSQGDAHLVLPSQS